MTIDETIKKHKSIVDKIVNKYCKSNPKFVNDIDDFTQIGLIGLWDAIKSYDESKNKNFSSYAYYIVKLKIFGEIRRLNSRKNMEFSVMNIRSLNEKIEDNEDEICTLEEAVGKEDEIIDLESFINDLDDEDRHIIKHVVLSSSTSEIMRNTGFSRRETIRKIHKAKKEVRKVCIVIVV